MNKSYQRMPSAWCLLLVAVLSLLASQQPAAAQSGPYGNEWIVPSQQYYKIKVWRDGIYKIDYQYLLSAGISGVDPSRIQLWRRGREVAIYQGGSPNVLDQNTYFEFFGQRNDGKLDAEYYKNPADQPHQFYSFTTDTAAYFLTYSIGATGQPGRRMSTPVAAGGTPHGWRLQQSLTLENYAYMESPRGDTYLPWLEAGEGFLSVDIGNNAAVVTDNADSLRAVPPAGVGPAPRLDFAITGANLSSHSTNILSRVGNTSRLLGTLNYQDYMVVKGSYPLLRSDIQDGVAPTGSRFTIHVQVNNQNLSRVPRDLFRVAYFRVTAPQQNRWFTNRRQLYFLNDSLLAGPATYEVDSIPATVRGFDIHDPWNVQRIEPTAAQTLGPLGRRFVFPSATGQQSRRLLLYDLARTLTPAPARPLRFRNINPAVPNYLIVTHKQLMQSATRANGSMVPNAAKAYAEYRASAAGGRYDTLMVTSHQLYDQFHYGERSVMAVRHFGLWMANNAPTGQVKYLMLLGKGIAPNEYLVGNPLPARRTTRFTGEMGLDLVPTSTRGISDNFLTSDFRNNNFVAKLPTGRITAKTSQEVIDYLDKVVAHESPNYANPAYAPWRKNVLHLSGGANPFEFAEFDGFLNQYKSRVEQPCYVGRVVRTYSRTTVGGYTSLPVSINIANELNPGLALITYFGHGSNTEFALNLGNVSDPSTNYNNQGKYPVMFYNGCAAGQLYGNYPTFGENWLLTANKGSIGLMAETGFSYAHLLNPAQDSMYARLFNNPSWYGKPIALVHGEVVKSLQLQTAYQSPEGIEQLLCTTWHGDPALRLYSPALPDFQTNNSLLSVSPGPGQTVVSANSPSLTLNVGVNNPGNFCLQRGDSIYIRVTRYYGSTGRVESTLHKLRLIHQTNATYHLEQPNTGAGIFGNNRFVVEVDYGNREPELDETNNTAEIFYNFLQGGVTLLNPTEFAIVPTNTPRLVAQTNTPNGPERGFVFELDTVPTFNSGSRYQTVVKRGSVIAEWTPTLPTAMNGDSVVWYWRVRFETPQPDEDGNWVSSSFRVIPGLQGWSQSHYAQFKRDEREAVDVAAPSGRWSFTEELKPMQLRTRGGGPRGSAATFTATNGYGIFADPNTAPFVNNCAILVPNIMVAVYDKVTLQPKAVAGSSLTCGQGNQQFYIFGVNPTSAADTLNNINNSATRQGELSTLLNNVPNGDYVALIGMNRVRWAGLPASLKSTLSSLLGSQLINQLQNGDPLAVLAQKNSAGGRLIREVGPATGSAVPRYDQIISLADTLRTPSKRGKVISTRIGPAQQWQTLSHWVTKETATSSYTLQLVGIDNQGQRTVLNANVPTSTSLTSYSLSGNGVSAQTYPYLQLELMLQDTVNRVAPQLQEWFITYRGLPEGVVRRDAVAASLYDPARLVSQATTNGTISFPVRFDNVAAVEFGTPLKARVAIHANNNGLPGSEIAFREITATRQLMANDTMTFHASLNVIGRFGSFIPVVTVNPPGANALPELNYFNNQLVLPPFSVADANLPPTLDVAFDGRRILNGELVSPRPVILIQLNDEDRLRHVRNVSFFNVTLQRQGGAPMPVDLNGSNIVFSVDSTQGSVARLEYQPGKDTPLVDGMYTLRVQGRDPSNANAGAQEFEVKFEVVNASTITNIYPYPNPVTSKARFVFTVTGQELPRDMKIQIMTIAGRVVREIFLAELGPLHIGNNITEFAWDGTDQYGDRLANGTYLYRVALDDASGQFKQRATAGDKAFKNDWGKLVLMR